MKNSAISFDRHLFKIAGITAASAGFFSLGAEVQAQTTTILSDGFTHGAAGGTGLRGLTPDGANLGGQTWASTGGNFYDSREFSGSTSQNTGTVTNFASSRNNGSSDGISIASNGSYIEPNVLTISAGVSPIGGQASPVTAPSGTVYGLLGFFSTSQSAQYQISPLANFVGLRLSSTGTIDYNVHGTNTSSGLSLGTGIFDANGISGAGTGFANLQYTLTFNPVTDTATFSNITVNGTLYANTFTTPNLASTTPTAFAGFEGTSGGFPSGTAYTNLLVTGVVVPEPATYALLTAGALGLGAAYRGRRRTSA